MKTWLVLDVSYLCHRAFHVNKGLSWKGISTGVVFGFLKSVTFLKDEFQTDRVAFCFEHPHLFRRDLYPSYKRKRSAQERTEEEKESYHVLSIQISELRRRYLPRIGFKNIFCHYGMESDDIMASIALNCPEDEEVILVTADSDLLQCLRSNVSIYSPQKRKILIEAWFLSQYGIPARKWALVKAIAGCPTDEVRGVKGVGEITALKYLTDRLPDGVQRRAILSAEGRAIVRRNQLLVKLPHPNCPVSRLVDDQVDRGGWREVCGLLGMRSIAGHPPVATRVRRR